MFPRRNRLSREEIALVTKNGKAVHTPLFTLKLLPHASGTGHKFAFVISKKESKTAVSRNRAKRRVRGAMQKLVPKLDKPLYCIVFIKKAVLDTPFGDIVLSLNKALQANKLTS